jgi:phage pi2 protein 07
MRVKGKRVLKNGTIAGYVYYKKEKKWKWRFISGKKRMKGGEIIEAGRIPVFVDNGNTVMISGLIDCIGVVIRRLNTNNEVDSVIAGHFVTGNMTNINIKTNFNMTTKIRTVRLLSKPEMTVKGMEFVNKMEQLINEYNFENYDIQYFVTPMTAGVNLKYHDNLPYAVALLNNSFDKVGEILHLPSSKLTIKV